VRWMLQPLRSSRTLLNLWLLEDGDSGTIVDTANHRSRCGRLVPMKDKIFSGNKEMRENCALFVIPLTHPLTLRWPNAAGALRAQLRRRDVDDAGRLLYPTRPTRCARRKRLHGEAV